MHPHSSFVKQARGSALITAICAVFVLSIVGLSVLSYTLTNYRMAARKQVMERARVAASNEMEWLFYNWATYADDLVESKLSGMTPALVVDSSKIVLKDPATYYLDQSTAITQGLSAADLTDIQNLFPSLKIARSVTAVPISATGVVTMSNGQTKTGSVKYYDAKTYAQIDDPRFGKILVTQGRRFAFQKVSPFNFALFYQNDLELNPGSDMYVTGDIESNGSVYMGTGNDPTTGNPIKLKLGNKIYYTDKFQGSDDPLVGNQRALTGSKPNDPIAADGTWDNNPLHGRAVQVTHQSGKDDFVGIADEKDATRTAASIQSKYPAAYPTENDVYRSLISPPPTDSSGTLIPEDATIKQNRMYNKAFLRIVVHADKSVTMEDASGASLGSAPTSVIASGEVRKPVRDAREDYEINPSNTTSGHLDINMTTIDVAGLKSYIDSNDTLKAAYNGVVYVYDESSQYVDSSGTTPISAGRNAVRLINGQEIPNVNNMGFTVATDNGLYIKGDYNTTNKASSAIMADAVTVLSSDWDDANTVDASGKSTDQTSRKALHNLTINSAIISGNTQENATYSSGGAQNLVRYLEDWYSNTSSATTLNGSIDQLFRSKYFNSHYLGNSTGFRVYTQPRTRNMTFDSSLASNPPGGAPAAKISYYRGDLYTWQ